MFKSIPANMSKSTAINYTELIKAFEGMQASARALGVHSPFEQQFQRKHLQSNAHDNPIHLEQLLQLYIKFSHDVLTMTF